MKIININTKIHDLIKEHPDVKAIMQKLGFDNVVNPIMLNTVGKVMTLKTGSEMTKIDLETIKQVFLQYDYLLEDHI